jgi:uncharacterized OB-fold protein
VAEILAAHNLTSGPLRVPPMLTDANRAFWTGGETGRLLVTRCASCRTWLHPPVPYCRHCGTREVVPEETSGRGQVATFSVNGQRWSAEASADPYVVAIVELAEQPGLRLITNIVNCPAREVRIGMPVRVVFAPFEDVWLPLFEPDQDAAGSAPAGSAVG